MSYVSIAKRAKCNGFTFFAFATIERCKAETRHLLSLNDGGGIHPTTAHFAFPSNPKLHFLFSSSFLSHGSRSGGGEKEEEE